MSMQVNDPSEVDRFHVGTMIAGRYRVERPLGEGAMGAVALARHVNLDEKVAIKFLRPELRRDPVAVARLSREARVLARIRSDHVARVLDVGATLSVGPYMVMEYLEGVDLAEVLASEGPLPMERAVEIVLQVCEALTVAHTAGITHRDIKPENLFLARHGQFETLKVLDFGISDDENVAGERAVYGTPMYMSPERILELATVDHRCDIWSVGVVLHEIVTGRTLFEAPTVAETCARVVSDAPILLDDDARSPPLPPALRSVIGRCLEREPARRYQSIEELAAALAPLGTMHERFRGRSTGAFSRNLCLQAPAGEIERPLLPPARDASRTMADSAPLGEPASVGRLMRSIAGARLHGRPLWVYAAVALVSASSAVIVSALGGEIRWLSPPPVHARSAPAARSPALAAEPRNGPTGGGQRSAPSTDAEQSAVEVPPPTAPAESTAQLESRAAVASVPTWPRQAPARATHGEGADIHIGDATKADPSRSQRRRPGVEPRADAKVSKAREKRRLVGARSRVRLVGEERSRQRSKARKPARQTGAPASPAPRGDDATPEWLELMRAEPRAR